MNQLLSQEDFFVKYNIEQKDFEKSKLNWNDLKLIYDDYCKEIPILEDIAIHLFNRLMKISNVHSVRYRVKDAEHVIEKIIRKKSKNQKLKLTLTTLKMSLQI
jgi:putative GTP pyrophosphokinase